MRKGCEIVVLTALLLLGCRERPAEPADAPVPEVVPEGTCAVDVQTGALIGRILGVGTDPETGARAYRVQLETDPTDTAYVGLQVDRVDCAAALDAAP